VRLIYYLTKSREGRRRLAQSLSRRIPEKLGHPWWARILERLALRWLLGRMLAEKLPLERTHAEDLLSDASQKRLATYLSWYLWRQLERECWKQDSSRFSEDHPVPDRMNFIFGHTHKPFERTGRLDGYAEDVHIYNGGGWVIDTIDPLPAQGGAIVVVDDQGHVTSIRMYDQSEGPRPSPVSVACADPDGEEANPLYAHLKRIVDPDQPPWSDFTKLLTEAVAVRRQNLKEIIDQTILGG
jgi:hypothetical protein